MELTMYTYTLCNNGSILYQLHNGLDSEPAYPEPLTILTWSRSVRSEER